MCKYATPFTDENGQYDYHLCMKDWEICDGICNLHLKKCSKVLDYIEGSKQKDYNS